jgi:hypothetical protein
MRLSERGEPKGGRSKEGTAGSLLVVKGHPEHYLPSAGMVGVTGFEPATSWSQTKHSTGLSYTPTVSAASLPHPGASLPGVARGVVYNEALGVSPA